MSELKVNSIKGTGASTAAITIDSSAGTCTANITNRSNENYIINGGCVVDQRNAGSAVTSGYAIDRTHIEGFDGGGTGTAQRVTDSPSGLSNSLKVTVTGTDTSLASSAFYTLRHIIEGRNIAHLGFGASGGTSVTLSFFVKSSVTGTFCASLGNGTNNRTMPKEYTISSANTWEKKSLTFPADTTGTWGTDNGRGFSIRWCMGVGSTRQGTADTYNGNEAHGTANQTNLFATNGATFQITGLKLESGTVATDFIPRSFGQELALCQRYCFRFSSDGGSSNGHFARFPVGYFVGSNMASVGMHHPPMRAVAGRTITHNINNFEAFFNGGGGTINPTIVLMSDGMWTSFTYFNITTFPSNAGGEGSMMTGRVYNIPGWYIIIENEL